MEATRETEHRHLAEGTLTMVSDCFGDRKIVEVILPRAIALADLDRLSNVTEQTILHNLPRPFFRIDCVGHFLLTGIANDPKIRFVLRQSAVSRSRAIVLQAVGELLGNKQLEDEQIRDKQLGDKRLNLEGHLA